MSLLGRDCHFATMVFVPPSSIGDIIAVVTLIAQVIGTLANSGQQLEEYKGLLSELRELTKLFEKVEQVGKSSLSPDALAIYLAITEHVMQSKTAIEYFQKNRLPPKKWYKRLIWSFLAGGRADSLRRKLYTHRMAIDTYLNL